MELHQLTLKEARRALDSRQVSSRELTQAYIDRIESVDERVGAYLWRDPEAALRQADAADKRLASGEKGALLGAPVGVKDVLATEGEPLTCASKILDGFVSPYDATVISRLRDAGSVFVGRLNMDEFAMGSSTENSAYQLTRNPWDLERTPGGSSGGSAAAVSADECVWALGSDTGGSIRQPASYCGCVGLKPTYGRVSRYGLVAFASSLDQVGPVTKTVADAADILEVISGHDEMDSTSAPFPALAVGDALEGEVRGLKIGMPSEYFGPGLDPEVAELTRAAIAQLEAMGAEIVDVSLPHTEYAVATYYIVATAEASANLSRFDGIRYGRRVPSDNLFDLNAKTRGEGFGPEVKRRVLLGTYALSSGYYDAYYIRAQRVRTLIRRDFEQAFESVDAIVGPTAPTPAFKIGEKSTDPLQMYLNDIFTLSCNLAGICGISVPCGKTASGLPVGLQFQGKAFDETTILRLAHAYESARSVDVGRPQL